MGKRIFECRKKMGITQEELAEKMEVSPQTISYAEQGAKVMRPENIVKLCKFLNTTSDYLLTGETPKTDATSLVEKLSVLSKEELYFVEMIINDCIGLCNLKNGSFASYYRNEINSNNL